MRFLLIASNQFKHPWPVIPYGACCVAAAVRASGHEVRVLDLCFSRDTEQDIQTALRGFQPHAVGVSIRNIDDGCAVAPHFFLDDIKEKVMVPLRKSFSGALIIGGPAVGINAAEMLDFFDIEYAALGDGERVVVAFLDALKANLTPIGIPGLLARKAGQEHLSVPPCNNSDLKDFPLPNMAEIIDVKPYLQFDGHFQVQTKRGCALRCTYCSYGAIEGSHYRLRDPSSVADHIERVVKKTGVNHFEFTDSTFNIPLDHAKAVLRAIKQKGLKLRLRTMGLNPGAVDEELVRLMRETGFTNVDLGVESLSDECLKALGKDFSVRDIFRAADLLRRYRIPTNWFMLFGAPAETEATIRETCTRLRKVVGFLDFVTVGIGIRAYKGTAIANMMQSENPAVTRDSFLSPVALEPRGLSLRELDLLVKIEASRQPQAYIFGPDQTMPFLVMRIVFGLWKLFLPAIPVWVVITLKNTVSTWLGLTAWRRVGLTRELAASRRAQEETSTTEPRTGVI